MSTRSMMMMTNAYSCLVVRFCFHEFVVSVKFGALHYVQKAGTCIVHGIVSRGDQMFGAYRYRRSNMTRECCYRDIVRVNANSLSA